MDPVLLVRLLEPPIFVGTCILLIWLSLPGANPLRATFRPVWRVLTRRGYLLYILIGFLVIGGDVVLTAVDAHFTAAVQRWFGPEAFSSLLWSIEGDFVAAFQRWTWPPLTWYLAWAYIVVFPALVPWAMAVFDYLGRTQKNISLLVAYILNYLLVLPFYVFFPVLECHEFRPGGEPFVRLALDDIHPAVMEVLRPMSGIDNCFPSFHTSLAVTVAAFAITSGRRAFAGVTSLMALSIIFSTLYLGIHWATDVAAGIAVGLVAYVLGEWLGRKFSPRLGQQKEAAAPTVTGLA